MATREKWIFSSMKKDVDAIVLMNAVEPNLDNSFFYATGITEGLFEGCMTIIEPRRTEVLASELEALSSREAGVRTTVFNNEEHRNKLAAKRLRGKKRIGINPKELTLANYRVIKKIARGARLVDVSKDISRARLRKQPDEIAMIRKACRIASEVAESIPDIAHEGMTETDLAAKINYEMMARGATGPSFVTAAAFGPGSAAPHHNPGENKLKKGQLALFDFGAVYRRYVSDITRTFVCGKASQKQKEMHDVVLKAQLAALDAIHDGAHGMAVDKAARDIIDRSKFKGRFIHSTGHGLGISVHDPGSLSPLRDLVLKSGMVLTVEPGVYIEGFGGVRIEDDILVTKKGCEILTPCTKDLVSI